MKNTNKKLERWAMIAKEACEQSHRVDVPKIRDIIRFKDIVNIEWNNTGRYYKKEYGERMLVATIKK